MKTPEQLAHKTRFFGRLYLFPTQKGRDEFVTALFVLIGIMNWFLLVAYFGVAST